MTESLFRRDSFVVLFMFVFVPERKHPRRCLRIGSILFYLHLGMFLLLVCSPIHLLHYYAFAGTHRRHSVVRLYVRAVLDVRHTLPLQLTNCLPQAL